MCMERPSHKEKELQYFCLGSVALLFLVAFYFGDWKEILDGMVGIVRSRDALITDYFEIAGYGSGFFNAAVMLLFAMGLVYMAKVPYSGVTLAAIFLNAGFAFWGKNPVNVLPIVFGTWCYARLHKMHFARVVYTAIFATCLAPFVTELVYILPFKPMWNLLIAAILGVLIGFVAPPLAMHTASMHMGYNLFNVGFASGILAFVIYSVLKSMGIQSQAVFFWRAEQNKTILLGMFFYFLVTFFIGLWLAEGRLKGLFKISRHPGRAVADFVMMDGAGTTLMNMGLLGMIAEFYVLSVEGDMSGPVVGGILAVFAFGAFGANIRNYIPVLLGVYLAGVGSIYQVDSPSMLIAAMFVVGIAPIAGQFGILAGVVSGMIHAAVVNCTSQLYGGLNLYNNGFAAGFVAIVMVPLIESGMKRFEMRRYEKREELKLKNPELLEKILRFEMRKNEKKRKEEIE